MSDPLTVAIFDFDGTLLPANSWKGVVRWHQAHSQRLSWLAGFFARQLPAYALVKLGLGNYDHIRGRWMETMAGIFAGRTQAEMESMADWICRNFIVPDLRPEVAALLARHQARGRRIIIVSGLYQPILEQAARHLGVHHVLGTVLESKSGRYTGRTVGGWGGLRKAARLTALLTTLADEVRLDLSYAYADSESDLELLEMVGNPVAVYPARRLAAVAHERGWPIIGQVGAGGV